MTTRRAFGAGMAGALALAAWPARADTFPSRGIKFVVPFAAGSATDAVARIIGERASAELKQTIIVENVAGASGVLAAQQVARAEPDGYTVLITTNTTHGANQSLLKRVPYDALADFAPITRLGYNPLVLVVNPALPVTSVAELVAYAKANPGKLSFGSGSSSSRVCGELLKMRAGIDVVHVPYRSIPPALTDVVGGQISFTFADPQSGVPQIEGGKVRGLAVSGRSRVALAPSLPTMEEAGIADYEIVAYFAGFAPARTPPAVVERLHGALTVAARDPAIVAKLTAVGIEPSVSSSTELRDQVAAEIQKWAAIVKSAGIEPQ
ncbi:MAG: transporter substrate-binding protein [Enterovirga sp.]|nr:transporter substrate-binding protein [Enterovirga sp.]